MEPFDADLLARVQTLHREIEERTLEVTSLRRSIPAQTAALFQQSCCLPEMPQGADSSATAEGAEAGIRVEREGEVKETFTKGMRLLKDLKKGVPATSAKLERSREVVAHVYS
jgi:kinetochor protein Mis14/NSL1